MSGKSAAIALRVGVAGAGRAFERIYLPALRRCASLQLVAIADPLPARRTLVKASVHAFPSFEAMLERAPLDALILLTPPRLHASQARIAVERGLPVLVEKPIALSEEELEALPAAAGRLLTPAFTRRYWPVYEQLETLAATPGEVRISLRTSSAAWASLDPGPPDVATDLLPHLTDLLRRSRAGEAVRVTARGDERDLELKIERSSGAGATCAVHDGGSYEEWFEGAGTRVRVPSRDPRAYLAELLRRPRVDVVGAAAMLDDWGLRLRGGSPERLPCLDDGVASVRVMLSAIRSRDLGGATVELSAAPARA